MIDSNYWKRNSIRRVAFFYLLLLAVALQAQSPAHKTMSGESGPETRKRYPAYQAPGLIIRQGETQVILPRQPVYCGAAFIFKFNNGDVQVSLAYNSPPEGYKARRSTDGGKTWADARTRITVNAYQFADGELVWFDDMEARPVNQQVRKKTPGVYQIDFFRSKDNGYTETKEIATLHIPDPPGCSAPANCPMYVNDSIVRLRDGSLLACYQLDDNPRERLHTWRTAVMRSTDRGKTWHYLSTVVFDLNLDPETREPAKRSEGFVEPNLLALANGDLLCFMRSGGLGHGRNTPLYMSRSNDDGKTWSHADPIADRGVFPNSVVLQNGVSVVNYGRDGNWLIFSLDQGNTWISPFNFYLGPEPCDCGNYFSLEEVEPNKLLVVYSRTDSNDCRLSEVLGTYFTVERVAPSVSPVKAPGK